MILLQSSDVFDNLAQLDTTTGQITWLSKTSNPDLAAISPQGSIAELDQQTLCFYRESGVLHFRVDARDIEFVEGVTVDLTHISTDKNRITIHSRGKILFSWDYRRPIIDPPLRDDPTPFIEEEDFDFCLFLHNVISDPGRKDRIFR